MEYGLTILVLSTQQSIFLPLAFSSAKVALAPANMTDMMNNLVSWKDSIPSKLQQFDCIFSRSKRKSNISNNILHVPVLYQDCIVQAHIKERLFIN